MLNEDLDEADAVGGYVYTSPNPKSLFPNRMLDVYGFSRFHVNEQGEDAHGENGQSDTRWWQNALTWWDDLHWGWQLGIGAVVITGLGIATALTGGAAGVIFGAMFKGAVTSGAIGATVGAFTGLGASVTDISSGNWSNVGSNVLNSASGGFALGAVGGAAVGGALAGGNIAFGKTKILGTAQVNKKTFFHRMASNMQAGNMTMSGNFSEVHLNRQLRSAGLVGGKIRPDIIGIGSKGNPNLIVEVTSSSQTSISQLEKARLWASVNMNTTHKAIHWAGWLGRWLF